MSAARLGVGLFLGLVLFTVLASMIFLIGTGLFGDFAHPFWQWWLYLFEAPGNPTVRFWLIASGVPAFAAPFLMGLYAFVKSRRVTGRSLLRRARLAEAPIRAVTDNHGHARWMTMEEARARFPGPSEEYGGIVVGEAYDVSRDSVAKVPFRPSDRATWGQGGKAPLLIDPCEVGQAHCMMFAGSGGYKTTTAVSTLLTWTGSAVVFDPSVELGPMLRRARSEEMHHKVYELDPRTASTVGFNALDWIDIHSPLAEVDVRTVVEWVCGDTRQSGDNAEFFKQKGKELVTALLADMLWDMDPDPKAGPKTLRRLRKAVVTPEQNLRGLLTCIYEHSESSMAKELAGGLKDLVKETFSGVYANATSDTAWLSTAAYANLVSGSTFRTADVTDGKTTVFINIPLKALDANPAVARVITGALLNAAYEADGKIEGRVLFLLDEAARLGPMKILETARDCARKYRITLFPFYQSIGQLRELFGQEGPAKWFESVSWYGFAGVRSKETTEELASAVGEYGVLAWSEGANAGNQSRGFEAGTRSRGETKTYHELKRQLIRADEIMHDMRDDEQIIFAGSGHPLRCGRAIYFRRDDMRERVDANRFVRQKHDAASHRREQRKGHAGSPLAFFRTAFKRAQQAGFCRERVSKYSASNKHTPLRPGPMP